MKFVRKRLKNGMVVLFEKRDLPVVSFSISNRFGAAFEESKIKGIAHVIEHLLFTGTKTRTHEDISREIEKKGGILNAYTANEVTSYWFKLPSEHLFAGIDILVDMLKNAKFDPIKFEKEKRVILEEIKMYHDRPEVDVFRLLEEQMYDKPLGEGIIGSKETVSALKRDFVVDYFKKMYSPENFVVTIVGNADIDKVCKRMEKEFKPSGNKQQIKTIVKKKGDAKEERESIDQAHLVLGVHTPLASEKDFAAWEVMDAYLASGMSSQLFLKIREEKGLAYSVRSTFNTEGHYSYYTIYVGTTKEAVPEVKKMIIEGFENIEKMTEKDLKEAKERIIGLKRVHSEESSNVMNELLFTELNEGNAEEYYTHEEKIKKVTLADVKRVAKIKGYSTAMIVPK